MIDTLNYPTDTFLGSGGHSPVWSPEPPCVRLEPSCVRQVPGIAEVEAALSSRVVFDAPEIAAPDAKSGSVARSRTAPLAQSAERLHGKYPARNAVLTCENAGYGGALWTKLDALKRPFSMAV